MKRFAAFLLFNVALACATWTKKIWTQTVSLADSNSWQSGRLPCSTTRNVRLPENEVVFMPNGFPLANQVVLPRDGMILLPSSSGQQTSFGGPEEKNCTRRNGTLAKPRYADWFDPGNWRGGVEENDDPVPHSERIPCRYDRVVMPPDAAFKLTIAAGHRVHVSRFQMDGEDVTTEQFRGTYSGGPFQKYGRMMLRMNGSLTIHGDSCGDPGVGCLCGNDDKINAVCSTDGAKCVEEVECSSPLKPRGHCCYDVCGGAVHVEARRKNDGKVDVMNILRAAVVATTKRETKNVWKKPSEKAGRVAHHISRVDDNSYQIVMVAEDVGLAIDAANNVLKQLRSNGNLEKAGYLVWMESSGATAWTKLGSPSGVFGLCLMSLTILMVLLLLAKHRFSGFPDGIVTTSARLGMLVRAHMEGFSRFGADRLVIELGNSSFSSHPSAVDPSDESQESEDTATAERSRMSMKLSELQQPEDEDVMMTTETHVNSFSNPLFADPSSFKQENRREPEESENSKDQQEEEEERKMENPWFFPTKPDHDDDDDELRYQQQDEKSGRVEKIETNLTAETVDGLRPTSRAGSTETMAQVGASGCALEKNEDGDSECDTGTKADNILADI